jgi:hypothetical protein
MKQENLDRILSTEEELAASSGFVASVMERVRDEAAAPQPIPFPWKRIVPAVLLLAGLLGWFIVALVRQGETGLWMVISVAGASLPTAATPLAETGGWVALALTVSLLSWLLSRRLIGRSGLV